jgi:hypothetical protein
VNAGGAGYSGPRLHPEEPPRHSREQPVQPAGPGGKILLPHHKIETLDHHDHKVRLEH